MCSFTLPNIYIMFYLEEAVCEQSCDIPCNGECKCEGYMMSGQGPSSTCVPGKILERDVLKARETTTANHSHLFIFLVIR